MHAHQIRNIIISYFMLSYQVLYIYFVCVPFHFFLFLTSGSLNGVRLSVRTQINIKHAQVFIRSLRTKREKEIVTPKTVIEPIGKYFKSLAN